MSDRPIRSEAAANWALAETPAEELREAHQRRYERWAAAKLLELRARKLNIALCSTRWIAGAAMAGAILAILANHWH